MADEKVEVAEAPSKEEVEKAKAEIAEEVRFFFEVGAWTVFLYCSLPFIY